MYGRDIHGWLNTSSNQITMGCITSVSCTPTFNCGELGDSGVGIGSINVQERFLQTTDHTIDRICIILRGLDKRAQDGG